MTISQVLGAMGDMFRALDQTIATNPRAFVGTIWRRAVATMAGGGQPAQSGNADRGYAECK
jgi:hypothetical protein